MKLLFLFSFASLLLLCGSACDRHPASQTIPGYQEKSHLLNGKEALTPGDHPVKFFSQKKISNN
jgi:hypothetical protein